MKFFIILLIAGAVGLGGWLIFDTWQNLREEEKPLRKEVPASIPEVSSAALEGLPPALESSLQAAQRRGAAGLRDWLRMYGRTVRDPRLAAIELDYVVLEVREDIGEARRVFAQVKARTPPASPVYARVKQLEKTYQ